MRYIIFLIILLLLPTVQADFFSPDSKFKPTDINTIFLVPLAGMTSSGLIVNDTCVEVIGGNLAGLRCVNFSVSIEVLMCNTINDCLLNQICNDTILICETAPPVLAPFPVSDCPNTVVEILLLIVLYAIAIFFVFYSFFVQSGLLKFITGIMIIFLSTVTAACHPAFAFVIFGSGAMFMLIAAIMVRNRQFN